MYRVRSLPVVAFLLAAVAWGSPPARYVASRQLLLEFQAEGAETPAEVDVWVSTDAGRTWQTAETTPAGATTLRYDAPADGKYDFYLALRAANGESEGPPPPGTPAMVSVIVDTLPPLLQVHAAGLRSEGDRPAVEMVATFIEENRSQEAVRVFYRTIPTEWIDGGPADIVETGLLWYAPTLLAPPVELRLIAVDRAGNPCVATAAVTPTPPSSPLDAVANKQAGASSTPETADAAATTQPAAPAGLAADRGRRSGPTLAHLRELAERFAACGQYSLAAARFEDALELAPKDADLLVDLGSTLYRLGRYDEAGRRFETALSLVNDHVGALEGLALVAATQRRYAVAREHLQRLLQLRPHSGATWLRAGDVEHRLGRTRPALEAWRRALAARDGDEELRAKARRRLEYFGPPPTEPEVPVAASGPPVPPPGQTWERPPPHPRSSLSSETKTTRSPTP